MKRFLCWIVGHKWKDAGHTITQWGGVDCYLKCKRCGESKTVEE